MSSGKAVMQSAMHSNQQPPTPSLAKRKKIQEKTDIRSPTDNMMSPCSRQLMKRAVKDTQASPSVSRYMREDKENAPHK